MRKLDPFICSIFWCLCITASGIEDKLVQSNDGLAKVSNNSQSNAQIPQLVIPVGVVKLDTNKTAVKNETVPKVLNNTDLSPSHFVPKSDVDIDPSGALYRGFIVFIGLSVIILLFFICRSYRIRNKNNSPVMVQKYGIRANRSDIEMQPLPLDDDEEDDTVVFQKFVNH